MDSPDCIGKCPSVESSHFGCRIPPVGCALFWAALSSGLPWHEIISVENIVPNDDEGEGDKKMHKDEFPMALRS